jgi:hypothetical protein
MIYFCASPGSDRTGTVSSPPAQPLAAMDVASFRADFNSWSGEARVVLLLPAT